MLEARDISLSRKAARILNGASIAVSPGEVVGVIGPNGAGKSTLLGVLSGALRPDGGRVTLDGMPVDDWPRQALARKRAVLPQADSLSFPFRAYDVVLLGRSPHAGLTGRKENLRIVEAAMRETGVLHVADRVYTTLSGGERQRVQLARVLAQIWPVEGGEASFRARYLLLDEPTNNLDLAHQQGSLITARRLADDGLGVVAILHDPNLAARHADRVYVMDGGRMVASGPPETVFTEALFEATFGLRVHVMSHPEHGTPFMLSA
ncbi:MAG: heme ABC transporter ATP-binding protein [Alphaproteobacteria bacterium]